jgi:hypothetical protein
MGKGFASEGRVHIKANGCCRVRSSWLESWRDRAGGPMIRWTTIACVTMLALIAGTVSYLHMHALVAMHGQPGWVAALTPLAVDGMIVAASTSLLSESRSGGRGGVLPWALLVIGSVASLAANVAVAEPTAAGRVIAAWPSFALIGSYELLMRQVRRAAFHAPGQAIERSLPRGSDSVAVRAAAPPGWSRRLARPANSPTPDQGDRRASTAWRVCRPLAVGCVYWADDRLRLGDLGDALAECFGSCCQLGVGGVGGGEPGGDGQDDGVGVAGGGHVPGGGGEVADPLVADGQVALPGGGGQAVRHLKATESLADNDGGDLIEALWNMRHTKGSHPGRSDANETRFRMQVITATPGPSFTAFHDKSRPEYCLDQCVR